jgi:hypothetical protein
MGEVRTYILSIAPHVDTIGSPAEVPEPRLFFLMGSPIPIADTSAKNYMTHDPTYFQSHRGINGSCLYCTTLCHASILFSNELIDA